MCLKFGGVVIEEKARTTIYLDKQIKNMIDTDNINVSKVVNEFFYKYFSVSNLEEIDKKILQTRSVLSSLEQKRSELVSQGVRETSDEAVADETLADLRSNFVIRKENEYSGDPDFAWISSPKNLSRCKILGKEPMQLLKELEKWYDGLQKNSES